MAINLQKGQGVSLRKESGYDLSRLTIGLGHRAKQPRLRP